MMREKVRLRLFIDGYREVVTGADLDITDCTPAMREAYEDGKRAARADLEERMKGPFNRRPELRP